MKSTLAALSFWNLVGRLTNSFLFIFIANLYGASQHTDWFFFVYAVVYFFIGISYSSTESALVSVWHKLPISEHRDLLRSAFTLSLYYYFFLLLIIELVGLFLAPIYGIPYNNAIEKAAFICLILSIQPPLAFISSFFSSYKQFQQKYIVPVLHLSFRTVGILCFLFFFQSRTIMILSISYLFGEVIRLASLIDKETIRLLFNISSSLTSKDVKKNKNIYKNISWMTVALAGTVINPVIDLAMVGKFGDGSVTLIEYANRLRGIPVLALGGLTVYYLGEWSYQHNKTENKITWNIVKKVLYRILFLSLISVAILMISESIWVPLVFFSKEFSRESIFKLKTLLYWYFPGVIFLAGNAILSRAVLVFQKEKTMALITIAASFVNIGLNFIFLNKIGLEGIALSTTIAEFLSFSALYIAVKRASS